MVPKNTVAQAKHLGRLMELVALANATQDRREYNISVNRGKWMCVYYYPMETLEAVYVVEKDTRMTDENINKAIKAMEKEIRKCTRP